MHKTVWSALAVCLFSATPARAADEAKVILDRALKAMGGADKVAAFQAVTWKYTGKVEAEDFKAELRGEWAAQAEGQYRCRFALSFDGGIPLRTALVVLDKDKGWISEENLPAQDIPKKGEDQAFLRTHFRIVRIAEGLVDLKDKAYQLAPLGELKIEQRVAVGIKATRKGWPDLDLFFDKETGLPVRGEFRFAESKDGQETVHTYYFGEYKEFKGVKHFTKISFRHDDKPKMELELTEIELHEKLDENTFAKP